MAKTLVVDSHESDSVPFLRGILTRSLQDAGLSFEESYNLASTVRDELRDVASITSDDLRQRVVVHLATFDPGVTERYAHRAPQTVLIRDADGHTAPYSRGFHRIELERSGLAADQAALVVEDVQGMLANQAMTEVETSELGRMTFAQIAHRLSDDAARRFAVWEQLKSSNHTLLIFVAGTSGSGKSTVATRVAHMLDIVRIQSTDMLREVMRTMIPRHLMPALHESSFNAWKVLPSQAQNDEGSDPLLSGYLTQVELVSSAVLASVHRAMQERVSLVMEGVHVSPVLIERMPREDNVILVPVTLAVLKQSELRRRLRGRGKQTTDRRAQRYLENFDALWQIQSYLLSEADRSGTPIVANDDIDETMRQVMLLVTDEISKTFSGDPDTAFAR